jgi:L-glutamine-phosphate cytidylyltransferase
MKIVILAAGKGERLMPLTRNTPKPLLDMGNGSTLLEEQIRSIQESAVISELVLVIGYLADQVEAKLSLHRTNGVKIKTVYNPFYEVSNNLMSLWLAKHDMDGDFMVTNGDNLFTPDVFGGLASVAGEGIFLAVSPKAQYDYDDMRVNLRDGAVGKVSKTIDDAETHAESPGLALVKGPRARRLFLAHLEELAKNREYLNRFWLEVFNRLYERGVSVQPWEFAASEKWQEVDFHYDVMKVRELITAKAETIRGGARK